MIGDIFHTLLSAFWWFVPVFVGILFFKSGTGKGFLGEWFVRMLLKMRLKSPEYLLFHNVMLPSGNGTTQIDHMVVSAYGIFVIETKNYGGWIFGGERQAMWTQRFHHATHRFQNPLFQNYKHTQTVTELFSLDKRCVISAVVFVGDAEFKTPMPPNVTKSNGLLDFIKMYKVAILTMEEVAQVIAYINFYKIPNNLKNYRAHKAHVTSIITEKKQPSLYRIRKAKKVDLPPSNMNS